MGSFMRECNTWKALHLKNVKRVPLHLQNLQSVRARCSKPNLRICQQKQNCSCCALSQRSAEAGFWIKYFEEMFDLVQESRSAQESVAQVTGSTGGYCPQIFFTGFEFGTFGKREGPRIPRYASDNSALVDKKYVLQRGYFSSKENQTNQRKIKFQKKV